MNKITIYIMIFIIALCLTGLFAQDNTATKYRTHITWPSVDGVSGYRIEIRNEAGVVIYTGDAVLNNADPMLPEGNFKLRITIIDKFRKSGDSTEWVSLSVIRPKIPLVVSIRMESPVIGKEVSTIITGENFLEGCAVTLVKENSVIAANNLKVESSQKLTCTFELTAAQSGEYFLFIENPAGRRSEGVSAHLITPEEAARLSAAQAPVIIRTIMPSKIITGDSDARIIINADNLAADATVSLFDGTSRFNVVTKITENGSLEVTIPRVKRIKSVYDITVSSHGKSDTRQEGLRIDLPPDGRAGLNGLYVGAGYCSFLITSQWNTVVKNSYLGGDIYAGHLLKGISFIPQYMWMQYVGVETTGDISYMTTKTLRNRLSGYLCAIPVSIGVYGSWTPFVFPLEGIIRADAGLAISWISLKSDNVSKKVYSIDPFISSGASLRYKFLRDYFVESGCNYMTFRYSEVTLDGVNIFMRAGMRF